MTSTKDIERTVEQIEKVEMQNLLLQVHISTLSNTIKHLKTKNMIC